MYVRGRINISCLPWKQELEDIGAEVRGSNLFYYDYAIGFAARTLTLRVKEFVPLALPVLDARSGPPIRPAFDTECLF